MNFRFFNLVVSVHFFSITAQKIFEPLQECLETIKKMREDAEQLEGELREWWQNEMVMVERRLDQEIRRVSDMIVVGEEGKMFASE